MFYFSFSFDFYLKNINAKNPITCTKVKVCANYRATSSSVLKVFLCSKFHSQTYFSFAFNYPIWNLFFTLHSSFFTFQVRIRNTSVIDRLQSVDKNNFCLRDVSECDRTFSEETICHLTVNQLVYKIGDALLCIFFQ